MSKYLIGAGGHASVILDIATKNHIKIDGVFVDKTQKDITGLPVIGEFKDILKYSGEDTEFMLAFGNIKIREKLEKELTDNGVKWFSLIDKDAVICSNVKVGEGTVIMPGAIVNSQASIGKHVIINSGSIVEHGCIISDHVHMSPRATICGNSKIGKGTWLCAGSIVIDDIFVGDDVIVGAGAVVIRNIKDKDKVVGIPAKTLIKFK